MEEAYDFYNLYALVKGFSIRWNQKGKSKKGVTHLNIVCSKQGLSKRQKNQGKPVGCSTKVKTPEKVRSSTRTGCKAYMRAKLVNGAIWEVTVFKDEHNHDLAPNSSSKNRILRSHRSLTMEDRDTIKNLSDQNIGPSKILEYLSVLHGGKDNVHFRRKDVSNVITTDNRKLLGKDVDSTLLHFQRKQDSDPEFFYAIDADEDGFVKHIFWADGRSRRAYLEFGDVVTFDTTYNTNKYSMPLAPFIGVNHHRQSIFFGMALLRSENAANFCWLFETWLKAMYGKHPKAIITDQDLAMKKAINIVFPNTVHRSCQWHVMRKAREQLGSLYGKKPTFAEELGWVINGSLTVSEFENAWAAMIDKHKVQSNKHLNNMFKKRADWAPAYFRGVFFAEMTTSQRSESMNALFKLWVNAHTSIYKFVCSIDHIIENIWATEGDEDLLSMNENPQLWSKFPFELDAREVYTRKVYSVFKQLLQDSCLGIAEERERGTLYEVKIDKNPDFKHWRPVSYLVKVDKEAMLFSCNCNGFEFQGLLCPHAMKVMWILGMQQLPSHYILKRWCKNANVGVKRPKIEDEAKEKKKGMKQIGVEDLDDETEDDEEELNTGDDEEETSRE
ncbi:hypothetical protein LUZ61_002448 [Rhynchospora tenuis]|uniref:SWIM-type domain-containing protein n=1 Tax=Rhynchospora tenuis TaxID=198213 RepID=A0AAD6ERP5_9POAL|nr:hypothetical protein LUZ61_002448 [Rhynchospora tenuis]